MFEPANNIGSEPLTSEELHYRAAVRRFPMNPLVTRKVFLRTVSIAGAAFAARPLLAQAPSPAQTASAPAQIESARVKEFVTAGHANLDKVKEMLAAQPAIVNATWDWGGGDFETALGGASHMGRRDIAELLLANGARADLFAAAMLGKLEVVKAAVAAFPNIVNVPGPHGIPLVAHAEKGGATAVVEFLNSLDPAKA